MQLASYITVLALAVIVGVLNTWASDSAASGPEKTVRSTAYYSIASGAAANVVCAVVARATHAVEAGDEMGACSPYGLIGTGIAARLHFYWINGYGPDEWAYVRGGPADAAMRLKGGLEGALSAAGLDLKTLGW